jgi:5-methylcytosine-specific restriction endonuclease McrA
MAEESALFPISNKGPHQKRMQVFERDGYQCRKCGKQLTRFTATLDYEKPPAEGGDESAENLVTACADCNSRKTSSSFRSLE